MKDLHDLGVRVWVLSNFLASNEVIAPHAVYADRCTQVLQSGVEVWGLHADPGVINKRLASLGVEAPLYTKALVFDRKGVFFGSFNLDLRSSDIDTDAGLYVESPELAAQALACLGEGVLPQNSYRVLLDVDGDFYWITESDGVQQRFDKDPKSTATQRSLAGFIRMPPVVGLL